MGCAPFSDAALQKWEEGAAPDREETMFCGDI